VADSERRRLLLGATEPSLTGLECLKPCGPDTCATERPDSSGQFC
jgi:hypothetical protein